MEKVACGNNIHSLFSKKGKEKLIIDDARRNNYFNY